ncbi:MAG: vWA domain-containing protein [Myxococcota bacterium]
MKRKDLRTSSMCIAAAAALCGACGSNAGSDDEDTGIDLPTGSASEDGGDSLDDGSGVDDGSDGTGPGDCGAATFMLDHQPSNVVLVLDKSFSMVDNSWDHDGDGSTEPITRWNSLHSSVSFIVDEFDTGLNFGAVLFPSTEVPDNEWETACHVLTEPDSPVTPLGGQAVLASLPGPDDVEIYGGTPASGGVSTALEHLRTLDDELPQAMILITDGAANCLEGTTEEDVFNLYDENLPGLVASAYNDQDIPTFVVGIDIIDEIANFPEDNPYERLNEVAIAGGFPRPGTEKFHNAQDEAELRSAISQISSQIGCTIPLDTAPDLPDLLSIVIDGEEIPNVDECGEADLGWRYVNPSGPYDEIELCGQACNSLHDVGTLAAHYNCIPPQ